MTGRFSMHQLESLESRRLLAADLLADVRGIYPTDSVQIDGISYFAADDGIHGKELWKSDNTQAGTVLVSDILPGSEGSNPTSLVVLDGAVLFTAADGIYRSDSSGVTKLADLDGDIERAHVAELDGKAIFFVKYKNQVLDLWSSDGTAGGTENVTNLYTPPSQGVGDLAVFDGRLFVKGAMIQALGDRLLYLDSRGRLFTTDGTAAGTSELATSVTEHEFVRSLVIMNGEALFLTQNADAEELEEGEVQLTFDGSFELWRTDGTVAGTEVIHSIAPRGAGQLEVAGDKAYFGAYDANDMLSLWATDGTSAGTQKIADLSDTAHLSEIETLPDGRIVLVLNGDAEGVESTVWVSDGTEAGTVQVASLGTENGSISTESIVANGSVYFLRGRLDMSSRGVRTQLWRTDGTTAGTTLVATINGGSFIHNQLELIDGKVVVTTGDQTYVHDPATTTAAAGPNQGKTTISDRVLRVFGTKHDDAIRVYRMSDNPDRFVVNINGAKRSFAFADVRKIIIYGYSGDDNIAFSEVNGPVVIRSMIQAGAGNDKIYGGSTRDSVWGGDGNDFIHTSVANDEAFGGMGDDTLLGMAGADTLDGEEGADSVIGGSHQDMISGGFDQSDDFLDGGGSADVIFGTAVFDTFFGGTEGGDPLDEVLLA